MQNSGLQAVPARTSGPALPLDRINETLLVGLLVYLSAAFVTMIVVSLFTRRVPAEQLDRFYGLVRTPVQLGEVVPAPCTLPDGVEPPPVRKLINHPDLEFYVPTWLSVIGFAAAWVAVGAIIAGVFWLVGIGA